MIDYYFYNLIISYEVNVWRKYERYTNAFILSLLCVEVKKFYKGFCFIATAVYEDYNHPQVMVLREFRDKYLLTNKLGTKFVNVYYKYSPVFADYVKGKKYLHILLENY
jgi:hypothetical protein